MDEVKTKKLIDLINEAKAKKLAERKAHMEFIVPEYLEQFTEFFGIEPDRWYYSEELDIIIFVSGDLEVTFKGSLTDSYQWHKRNEWGMVWACPDCGRKIEQEYGVSDVLYLSPEMPSYPHNHNSPQDDLINYLRQALGVGQDA